MHRNNWVSPKLSSIWLCLRPLFKVYIMKSSLTAVSAVALITLTLTHSLGLTPQPVALSMMPVWLLFMLIAALPLAFVDAVIVRRSQQLPLEGLVPITREADAAIFWRLLAPLSILALLLLMGQASHHATHNAAWTQPSLMLKEALPYLVMFFAVGFAWVGTKRLLPFVGVLVPVALVVNASTATHIWQLTLLTPEQWQLVASTALMSTVSTTGVYAWLLMQQVPVPVKASTRVVPLWLTQTLVGLAALAVGQTTGNIYLVMYMLCAIFALAVCAEAIGTQLQAKGWAKPIALGSVLLACAVTTTAAEYVGFDEAVKVVALLTILGFALLTGWIMKISHVRKALNFSSEAVYNVWRVAIRLLVPITVLWLLVGMVL